MITKIMEKNGINWLVLQKPTDEEILKIDEKFPLHPFIKNELAKPTFQPKINIYNGVLYLILQFPIFDDKMRISRRQEIDFVLGKNFLLTAYYGDFPPLQEFIKKMEGHPEIMEHYFHGNAGMIFFGILRHLYHFSLRELEHIQKKVDEIEEQIFLGKEKEMVEKISFLSRDIIEFGRSIKPHERILFLYENLAMNVFGDEYKSYTEEILNEYFNLQNLFSDADETIKSLQQTNDSLVSIKSNEEMRIISILAFTTFPLMLLTSVFGMNTSYLPIVGTKGDFWIIIGVMAGAMGIIFWLFKRKKMI